MEKELKRRDISSEKIKNISTLKLELPNFQGYNSSLDFYTFKYEFEKLISPQIYVKLLPGYLKNNYLEGQASEIVKEIDKIDDIWDRLKLSFCNVAILLHSKLSEIDNRFPFWKTQNEEKLIQMITKLINRMKELCRLAEKHDIEGTLFHPCNLGKIYDLIGKKRQQKIMEQTLGKDMTYQGDLV